MRFINYCIFIQYSFNLHRQMIAASSSPFAAAAGAHRLAGIEPASLSRLGVWSGREWQSANDEEALKVMPSGHECLDAELPGGGWPVGGMSEILLPGLLHPEWSLVAGALSRLLSVQPLQRVVLVAPPLQIFTPFAEMSGVPAQRLCCVHPDATGPASRRGMPDAAGVWVSEQALRCRDVAAVLAWLPHAQSQALRRLQLLAAQQRQLLWVFRPQEARVQSSPAPLRLWLKVHGRSLLVHVVKRRGPSLAGPVMLPLLHERLLCELTAQAWRKQRAQADAQALLGALRDPFRNPSREVPHALDGMAFAARR